MKTHIRVLAILTLAVVSFTSCNKITGEGPVVTQELELDNFTGVSNNSSNTVSITYGEEIKVIATGEANIIERIKTNVEDEVWNFELESGNYSNYTLSIEITMPKVVYLRMNGSGKLQASDMNGDSNNELTLRNNGSGRLLVSNFNAYTELSCKAQGSGSIQLSDFTAVLDELELELQGSGDISIKDSEIEADELEIDSSGSGGIYIESSDQSVFADVDITSNGSGSINLLECVSINCTSTQNGSGSISAHVRDKLDVTINGSGDFRYTGSPTIESNINGSGSVIRL